MGPGHPGPIPRAVGGFWYLYVIINMFTRWSEATLVVKINKQSVVKFIKSIIHRFGIPNRIITNNESQFTSSAFQGYCEDLGTKICYASIAHPKSNVQVKRVNAEILKGLKMCTYDYLKKHDAKWIDELPCALWANRTSSSRVMGETPFFSVYGAEVVIPPELTMVSPRVQAYDEAMQDQLRRDDVDLVNETRWQAALQNAWYRQTLQHYHQQFVHSKQLQVDDLVLRRILS
jgi:transposase InsO family protein